MPIWAIANQKGGVGKTTTTVSLAGQLVQRGSKVLLVDTDPHGSLSVYFRHDPDSIADSVFNLFHDYDRLDRARVRDLVRHTGTEGLDILPASTAMAALDRQMGTREGMGLVFKRAFALVNQDYDYILIDCPPLLGILMVNALAVCDHLLIPVQTEFLALKGLERIIHTLGMILRSRGGKLDYTVVPTLYDRRTRASLSALEVLQENYRAHLWPGVIPVDTQFREASRRGIPVNQLAASSRGAIAYAQLLDYLLQPGQQQRDAVAMS